MLGSGVGQYCVKPDKSCAPQSEDGVTFHVHQDMRSQCAMAAYDALSHGSRFAPAWHRQQVFVAVPTTDENTGKEWRLCSRVVSIGELMLALGHAYTSLDIELFWLSMTTAPEKRSVKERARKKKGKAQEQ